MELYDTPDRAKHRKEISNRRHNASILQRNYGISLFEFEQMLEAQDNKCALCKEPEQTIRRGKVQLLSVDHDHITGKVRGLLCMQCNTTLGKVNDDIEFLTRMIAYLNA
jgi:hypothetical protein